MKRFMNHQQKCAEASMRTYESGLITDDREEFEKNENLWLVKDMGLVFQAHLKDIEDGDAVEDAGPEEFFARHGIEVE